MSVGNSNEEAMLYYFYMMADGEVSNNEKRIFSTICKELEIDNDTKDELIKNCKRLAGITKDTLSIIVREKIDEKAGQNWTGLKDEASLARIIWNLINLGYADSFFSSEEKKIVDHCINKWSVNLEVYQELIDAADTMFALTKQKEWIVSTFPKGSARDKRKRAVNAEITRLLDDVKLTIEELTM